MGTDKLGTKGGGFLHLFDWNRKSRKKLFASVLPEGTKQASNSDDNLSSARLCLNDDNETSVLSTVKGCSNYSCTSSVMDEGENGNKLPGVVARLMGLDSLPTTASSAPSSTPFFEPRSLWDRPYQTVTPEFEVNNPLTIGVLKTEVYSRRPPELKCQKMPSSPIERFQREMLPSRSVKSLPNTSFKLLSPVKNPRFVSSEDAAHIMEAAIKILEPRCQASSNTKVPLIGSSLRPSKAHGIVEHVSPLRPTESNTMKQLRGQHLNKRLSGLEDHYSYAECYEINSTAMKDKGKSVSLAIQAKVNVQRRGSTSTYSRSSSFEKEQNDFELDRVNIQKNKVQKRVSVDTSSSAPKQKSQKQNCSTSKDKLHAKPTVVNLQTRKGVSFGTSSGRNKSLNKPPGNFKNEYNKEDPETTDTEKGTISSRTSSFTGKERSIKGNYFSQSSEFTSNILVGTHEKHLQPNVCVNEHLNWSKDSRKVGMDVVSFTFTSPIVKSRAGSQPFTKSKKKEATSSNNIVGSHDTKYLKSIPLSTTGMEAISGDELNTLLEKKLRELTLELETADTKQAEAAHETASATTLQDLLSSSETAEVAQKDRGDFPCRFAKDDLESATHSKTPLISGQSIELHLPLALENWMQCSSRSNDHNQLDYKHSSPFSVLEASFSNESCSSDLNVNGRGSYYSIQVQDSTGCNPVKKKPSVETQIDLSDSASSLLAKSFDGESMEVEYVSEILSAAQLNSDSSNGLAIGMLDPLIFHQLENKKNRFWSTDEVGRLKRKVLFDCVSECLDLKHICYFSTGYQTWTKGISLIGKQGFGEDIYKDISGRRDMDGYGVDELVRKDMSSYFGRWVGFDTDAFETGVEIEAMILNNLVDAMVDEFSV